jgi:hypothetical protein
MALSWIIDIITLDMRRMNLLGIVVNTLLFGLFGLLFTIGTAVKLFDTNNTGMEVSGLLFVFAIGAGLLARIAQGLVYYWRYTRTGAEPPAEPEP